MNCAWQQNTWLPPELALKLPWAEIKQAAQILSVLPCPLRALQDSRQTEVNTLGGAQRRAGHPCHLAAARQARKLPWADMKQLTPEPRHA